MSCLCQTSQNETVLSHWSWWLLHLKTANNVPRFPQKHSDWSRHHWWWRAVAPAPPESWQASIALLSLPLRTNESHCRPWRAPLIACSAAPPSERGNTLLCLWVEPFAQRSWACQNLTECSSEYFLPLSRSQDLGCQTWDRGGGDNKNIFWKLINESVVSEEYSNIAIKVSSTPKWLSSKTQQHRRNPVITQRILQAAKSWYCELTLYK